MLEQNHPTRYSMLSNIWFLIRSVWRFDRGLFVQIGLHTVLAAVQPFIFIIMPKLIIDELTGAARPPILLSQVLILAVVAVVVNVFIVATESAFNGRILMVRLRMMGLLSERQMEMDYAMAEDPAVLDRLRVARDAFWSNSTGVEGVLRILFALAGSAIAFAGYAAIVTRLSPWVLLYLVASVMVTYAYARRAKERDLACAWPVPAPIAAWTTWTTSCAISPMARTSGYTA